MAMVSAIQEAQKDNVRSFNDYMMKVLEVCILAIFNFNLMISHCDTILQCCCLSILHLYYAFIFVKRLFMDVDGLLSDILERYGC